MEIKEIVGDLLNSDASVIAHQVNCKGKMGSGIAKQIKEKWFNVYTEYKKAVNEIDRSDQLLGLCLLVDITDNRYVANLFGQNSYGYDGRRYTDYEAVYTSLEYLKGFMGTLNLTSIAFPYKMASDRGGADWDIIFAMIKSVFKDTNVVIEIYKLKD